MTFVPPRLSQPAVHDILYQILPSIARSDAHVVPLVTVEGRGTSTANLLVFLVLAGIFLVAGLGGESFVERI